jgi:hypothetical protein
MYIHTHHQQQQHYCIAGPVQEVPDVQQVMQPSVGSSRSYHGEGGQLPQCSRVL